MPQEVKFDPEVAKYLKNLKEHHRDHVEVILDRIKRGLYPGPNANLICSNPVLYDTILDPLMLPEGAYVGYRIVWTPGNYDVVCVTMIHDFSIPHA